MKKLYSSIIDTPILVWHYFYKFFVIHNTLKDESIILEKIELFKDDKDQLEYWQMNLRIHKSMVAKNQSFLNYSYGYLMPNTDYSEIAAETRGINSKKSIEEKENTCNAFYKNILQELQFKGLKDGSHNIELGQRLQTYIDQLANDRDVSSSIKYFKYLQQSENFNITNPQSWLNSVDIEFYILCENLQQDYTRDIKSLSIIEFFTRIRHLENIAKKQKQQ